MISEVIDQERKLQIRLSPHATKKGFELSNTDLYRQEGWSVDGEIVFVEKGWETLVDMANKISIDFQKFTEEDVPILKKIFSTKKNADKLSDTDTTDIAPLSNNLFSTELLVKTLSEC